MCRQKVDDRQVARDEARRRGVHFGIQEGGQIHRYGADLASDDGDAVLGDRSLLNKNVYIEMLTVSVPKSSSNQRKNGRAVWLSALK